MFHSVLAAFSWQSSGAADKAIRINRLFVDRADQFLWIEPQSRIVRGLLDPGLEYFSTSVIAGTPPEHQLAISVNGDQKQLPRAVGIRGKSGDKNLIVRPVPIG